MNHEKCVIVIDEHLPLGMIANTSAILGMSLGKERTDIIGDNVMDLDQHMHQGIIEFPVPVLKGNREILRGIMNQLWLSNDDLTVIDFTTLAMGCKTYEEYIDQMKNCKEENLDYIGILICGPKKKINQLTGSLPLLR